MFYFMQKLGKYQMMMPQLPDALLKESMEEAPPPNKIEYKSILHCLNDLD